jgi:hypothetical protein
MIVRRLTVLLAALLAFALATGCGGDRGALGAETDEPLYQQAKQLQRQGRHPEALTVFLKLIEQRGEQNTPESHFEVGLIYLNSVKDPIEAIHHFQKYRELRPNSPQDNGVKQLIGTAKREFARTLPGRPLEDQSVRLEMSDELERLRRENEELKAEMATLRGGAAAPVTRLAHPSSPMIDLSRAAPITAPTEESPITPAPPLRVADSSPFHPTTSAAQPAVANAPRASAKPVPAPAAGGRSHTVTGKDSLWSIARQYYGAPTGAKVQAIVEANRAALPNGASTPLKPGMQLRIP